MKIKTFKGNFFEIGKQLGKIYRKNGLNLNKVNIDSKLFRNQLKIYRKYYPELLEEFEGIAEAGNYDKDKLIYKFITGEILWYKNFIGLEKGCTIFGLKNKNGFFIGRNYDWHPVIEKVFQVYKVINLQRNSFIAITDMGIGRAAEANPKHFVYTVDDAINDKGLFIGITFAFNDKWSYGISSIHMTKLIMESCSKVNDAIDVFSNVPLCCPKNFFIADKKGNMAVVEHTSKKFKVINPTNNLLVHTNHYIDPELSFEDTILIHRPKHSSFLRYYETIQRINQEKEKFTLSDVINILGDTDSCTCQKLSHIKTVWSLALDMKKRRYKLYWNLFNNRKEKKLGL